MGRKCCISGALQRSSRLYRIVLRCFSTYSMVKPSHLVSLFPVKTKNAVVHTHDANALSQMSVHPSITTIPNA